MNTLYLIVLDVSFKTGGDTRLILIWVIFTQFMLFLFPSYYIIQIINMNHHSQLIQTISLQIPTQKHNSSSKENTQTYRRKYSIAISKNNFSFADISAKTAQQSTQHIHGKVGTKRIGGKVMMACLKNQVGSKETNVSKIDKRQKCIIECESKKTVNDYKQMRNGLSIKSYEFEQKTDNNEHSYIENRASINYQTQQPSSYLVKSESNFKHGQVEHMFKQLRRKMMAQSELLQNKKQKQNCFYATLKQKLKEQMFKTEEKQDYDRIHFTIEGCNANLHVKTSKWLLSQGKRQRPQTALNSPQAEDCSSNNKKRPLLDRRKSYNSLEKSRTISQLKNKTIDILNANRYERHTARQLQTLPINPSQKMVIQPQKQSLRQRNRHIRNRSQDNLKINRILGECDDYSEGQRILKDNMKIFQFYCKKIDARFQKASHQLDIVQALEMQ